ncbi:hypothetical protein BTE77_05830 [Ensifer adhaerens]|nr:hypothetical protein BTE77_05830 [Ensifer adhaerens]
MGKLISEYWERVVFGVFGLIGLIFSFKYMYAEKVTEASAVFAIAFLSFLYANVSRFKRFKGLGFEAELWEDKQKEAADLIERLKSVVSIYTNEVVLTAVKQGRLVSGTQWQEKWKLFHDLVEQHDSLGQKIDFSALKKKVDDYFLFDMCIQPARSLQRAIRDGENKASANIKNEFGSPITDADGYSKRSQQLSEVKNHIEDAFQVGQSQNLAKLTLEMAEDAKAKLKSGFGVDLQLPENEISRLVAISGLYEKRPIQVTSELISWAER